MKIKDWYKSLSRNELEQVAKLAGTTFRYLNQIYGGWATPSIKLKIKIIDAAKEFTPDRVPEFEGFDLRIGRKWALNDMQIKKMINEYLNTSICIKVLCDKYQISENTFDKYLRMNKVARNRNMAKEGKLCLNLV